MVDLSQYPFWIAVPNGLDQDEFDYGIYCMRGSIYEWLEENYGQPANNEPIGVDAIWGWGTTPNQTTIKVGFLSKDHATVAKLFLS